MSVQPARTPHNAIPARQATSGLLQIMKHLELQWRTRLDAAPANQFTTNIVKNAHRRRAPHLTPQP